MQVGGDDVTLMIWDVAGAEEHFSVPSSYVKGAAGYLLVVDGTRPDTLDDAARHRRADGARTRAAAVRAGAEQERPRATLAGRREAAIAAARRAASQ